MKEIRLTKGQVAIVDDEDYERINAHKWRTQLNRRTRSYYAVRKPPRDASGKTCTIYMHREVMGAKNGEDVDHINHETLDQRKTNLRLCTRSQNNANHRMQSNNTSGFRGVSLLKQNGEWRAYVKIDGKQKYIGRFLTAIEAAMAHDEAAVKYQGEFACTNKMMGLLPE